MGLFDGIFNPDFYNGGGLLGNGAGLMPQQPTQSQGFPSDTPISDWLQKFLTGGTQGQPSPTAFPGSSAPPIPMAGMMSPQGTYRFGNQAPQQQQPPIAQAPQAPLNPNMTANAPSDTGFQYGPGGQQAWQQAGAQGALPPNAQPAQFQPQQQQAPQQQPSGSFLDRIATGANNFATAPSFLGGLAEGARGLTGGRDSNATLQKTGTDPFTGQDTFAWTNPRNQSMTPATLGAAGAPGQAPVGMGPLAEAIRSGKTGPELMSLAPPEVRNRLQAILSGREAPPGPNNRNPQTQALVTAAHAIDDKFDENTWAARHEMFVGYSKGSNGSLGGQRNAGNTALSHLGTASDAAADLGNVSMPGGVLPSLAHFINWARQEGTEQQKAKANAMNDIIDRYVTEVGKFYAGSSSGGTNEREEARKRFGSMLTGPELAASINSEKNLMHGKLLQLEQQRDQTFNGNGQAAIGPIIQPHAEEALKKVDANVTRLNGQGGSAPQTIAPPKIDMVQGGYRFRGGNPADKNNWVKVN